MSSSTELANAIRALSMDAVQRANSGHPGAPMGMADLAEVVWRHFLKHNPANPAWPDRDRFVLSNGHASMLLYSLLHLTGYALTIDDLKNFRQLDSKTPGHPEADHTPGVETTTGPLGQGLANAVGMAIAERTLAAQFNRPGHTIINHRTWVFMGDGCLMEGISHEACSLAGTLGLGKLIGFYDRNGISIDGEVQGWFTDDTAARFRAYHWHVIDEVDGHDPADIHRAIEQALQVTDQPSLIVCRTVIGFGAPNKAGKEEAHGAPLGESEIALARKQLHWDAPPFTIPAEIYRQWDAREEGAAVERAWNEKFATYRQAFPELAAELERRLAGKLPVEWQQKNSALIQQLQDNPQHIASRKASQNVIEYYGTWLPELLGGSADLAPSNLTLWSGSVAIKTQPDGNYIHYGVREFAMTAIGNGITRHGGFIPYTATFLIFSDYARNAIRLAALMKARQVLVYTHDSIGLGEDGPTHQPVEQLASLRMIPGLRVWRPSDQVETAVAWQAALEYQHGPTVLALSRQNLTQLTRDSNQLGNIARGGYVIKSCRGEADILLLATGSEVALALQAAEVLTHANYQVQVVSMPCSNLFDQQSDAYRQSVLPPAVKIRLAIEAGCDDGWYKYVGLDGAVISINRFGESAPAGALFRRYGYTVEHVVAQARSRLEK